MNSDIDTEKEVNEYLCPILKMVLCSPYNDDTLNLYSFEALRENVACINGHFLEELSLIAARGEHNRPASLEIIELLDPEVVRRWPLLSCEFRFQYRQLSYSGE